MKKINYNDLGKEFVKQIKKQGYKGLVTDDTSAWHDDIERALNNAIIRADGYYHCTAEVDGLDDYYVEFYVKYNHDSEEFYID